MKFTSFLDCHLRSYDNVTRFTRLLYW